MSNVGETGPGAEVITEEGGAAPQHAEPELNGEYIGNVKWFSAQKQFGFLLVDGYAKEIFVHQTQITTEPGNDNPTLITGQQVKFKFLEHNGKKKAFNVTNEDGSAFAKMHPTVSNPAFKKRMDSVEGLKCGTMKWFNPTKGFGFIVPEGGGADVFCHFSCIKGTNGPIQAMEGGTDVEYKLEKETKAGEKAKADEVTQPGGFAFPSGPPAGPHGGMMPRGGPPGGLLAQRPPAFGHPQPPRAGPPGYGMPPQAFAAAPRPSMGGAAGPSLRGSIKFYNSEKGYGFILPADGSTEVFVHSKGIVGADGSNLTIPTGTVVMYRTDVQKGQTRAIDCVAADGSPLGGGGGARAPAMGGQGFGGPPMPPQGQPQFDYSQQQGNYGAAAQQGYQQQAGYAQAQAAQAQAGYGGAAAQGYGAAPGYGGEAAAGFAGYPGYGAPAAPQAAGYGGYPGAAPAEYAGAESGGYDPFSYAQAQGGYGQQPQPTSYGGAYPGQAQGQGQSLLGKRAAPVQGQQQAGKQMRR